MIRRRQLRHYISLMMPIRHCCSILPPFIASLLRRIRFIFTCRYADGDTLMRCQRDITLIRYDTLLPWPYDMIATSFFSCYDFRQIHISPLLSHALYADATTILRFIAGVFQHTPPAPPAAYLVPLKATLPRHFSAAADIAHHLQHIDDDHHHHHHHAHHHHHCSPPSSPGSSPNTTTTTTINVADAHQPITQINFNRYLMPRIITWLHFIMVDALRHDGMLLR